LDRKLKVLRDEKIALIEETAMNETLGETVASRVKAVAKPQEANKFKTHVQEVGHITSLLLSLSGRLARVENALLDLLDPNHLEKVEKKKTIRILIILIGSMRHLNIRNVSHLYIFMNLNFLFSILYFIFINI